jgi:CRISPR-associated protein Cmr5
MTQRTLEQDRAKDAWRVVTAIKNGRNADIQEKFGQLARGAAADIQINGLGGTLAFWKAKKEPYHLDLYDAVSRWVINRLGENGDLLVWITDSADSVRYRLATNEALAYLMWLKRFSESELLNPKGK